MGVVKRAVKNREGTKKKKTWPWLIAAVILICAAAAIIYYYNRNDTSLTVSENAAIAEICAVDPEKFVNISKETLSKERAQKFPAVSKVFRYENLYAFIVNPVAYNGPITLALVIDGDRGESVGLRVIEHVETPHYVRDMDNMWFMDRFADKSVSQYLILVRQHAAAERDIVAITGATVTTEGVINGVNAAFGLYQEAILGQTAEAVPYKVRFEPGRGDGPVETESLVIRAYGVVLAEISLEDIRALPSVRRTMSIHSTAGNTQHDFRGTLLSNVLNLADPGLTKLYSNVTAIGVDDYSSGISMDEIKGENNVYIMYEDNGLPLQKINGEPGGMRVVVINDIFGQRFTNYLLEIVLESEEPLQ